MFGIHRKRHKCDSNLLDNGRPVCRTNCVIIIYQHDEIAVHLIFNV